MPEEMENRHIYAESNDWGIVLETKINEYFIDKKGTQQILLELPNCGPLVPDNMHGLEFQAAYWHPEWGAFVQKINNTSDIYICAKKTSADKMVNDIKTIIEKYIKLETIDID